MKTTYLLFVSCIALAGCMDAAVDPADRQPLGKADNYGSCEDHCGGQSDGACFCDDLCVEIGDCCADAADVCGIGDDECAAQDAHGVGLCEAFFGFAWNGSDCVGLSGCSCEGEDCGNLRFSKQECLDAAATCEFECPIDPTTVLCAPDTIFSVEECACVPVDPPECEAQDAHGSGICAAFWGYAWNGTSCVGVSGCSCEGEDCANLSFTPEACEAAAETCSFSPTCAELGGTCRSSSFDVTFPADCEGEFGETTNFDASCPAFNQACCI